MGVKVAGFDEKCGLELGLEVQGWRVSGGLGWC
jgi:hypothetical protein